jgi:hypothetical protein
VYISLHNNDWGIGVNAKAKTYPKNPKSSFYPKNPKSRTHFFIQQ